MKFIKYPLINIIFIFFSASASLACHKGDYESTAKGHHKWGKKVGIFQFTENTTITSATLTSCDIYTAFLESQYDYIQEQIVHGSGPHLDALSMMSGCNPDLNTEFSRTLRINYVELFSMGRNPQILRNRIENLIDSNSLLKMSCRKV